MCVYVVARDGQTERGRAQVRHTTLENQIDQKRLENDKIREQFERLSLESRQRSSEAFVREDKSGARLRCQRAWGQAALPPRRPTFT